MIIGLQAPGNDSDQFWSNKISMLLCERPKLTISMFSGVLSPWEPVFVDLDIPNNTCKTIRKSVGTLKNNIVINLKIPKTYFEFVGKDWDREMMKIRLKRS